MLGAAGAPDTVDVVLGHMRQFEIHDVRQLLDVESASGDVRGDERLELAVAKTLQRLLAFALACGWNAARPRRDCCA